jgi:hypothetical protein
MRVNFILNKNEDAAININSIDTIFIQFTNDRFIIYATVKNTDELFKCAEYLTELGAKEDLKILIDAINKT